MPDDDRSFGGLHAFVGARHADGKTVGRGRLIAEYESPDRRFCAFIALLQDFAHRQREASG